MPLGAPPLAGFCAAKWPVFAPPLTDTPAAALRAALVEAGLPAIGINTLRGDVEAGEFGVAAIPGREAEARAYIEQAFVYAQEVGIDAVHVMAGKAEGADASAVFAENLHYACDLAEQFGKTVLIEPLNSRDVPGYFLTRTDQARQIIEGVDRAPLAIMYDFYHMQIMQGDHVKTLEALDGMVGHIQLASVPDRKEPLAGEVDHAWTIGRAGYEGVIGLEYHPTRPPKECLSELVAAFASRHA